MKRFSVILAFCLGVLITFAIERCNRQAPAEPERTVMNLTWDSPNAVKITPSNFAVASVVSPEAATFTRVLPAFGGYARFRADLFNIPNPEVGRNYAITGEASYENTPDQTELILTACYPDGNVVSATEKTSGPNQYLAGTSAKRRFILPVQLSFPESRPLQLDLSLNIGTYNPEGGTEKLTLSDLKLVRYPDPPLNTSPSESSAPPPSGLDWKSFLLGTAATAIFCMAIAHSILLARRLRKLKRDQEIRQMSSLDG